MKRGVGSTTHGYTIIEVMIFLIVSTALLGSAVAGISQQNRRVQFSQSVTGFEQQLQDILNDVSTGFYPSTNNLTCVSSPVGIQANNSATPVDQGSNAGCIFVGKAIVPDTVDRAKYNIYTLAGKTFDASGASVTNLANAQIEALGTGGNGGIADSGSLLSGVEIVSIISIRAAAPAIDGFALISDFSQVSATGSVSGNSTRVALYEKRSGLAFSTINQKADSGILICLREPGNGRKASITVGGAGQNLSLAKTIDDWPRGPRGCEP